MLIHLVILICASQGRAHARFLLVYAHSGLILAIVRIFQLNLPCIVYTSRLLILAIPRLPLE